MRFTAETLPERRVLRQVRGQHLQRDDAAFDGVVGLVDRAHSTLAERSTDLVVAEARPFLQIADVVRHCDSPCAALLQYPLTAVDVAGQLRNQREDAGRESGRWRRV